MGRVREPGQDRGLKQGDRLGTVRMVRRDAGKQVGLADGYG